MALKSSPSKVFVPARSGVIECEVMDGLKTKDNFSTISTVDHDYVQDVARQSEHTSVLLQHSTLHAKLRLSEAFNIYKTMMTETNNKARVLMKLLPQVKDTSEAKKFVLKVFTCTCIHIYINKSTICSLNAFASFLSPFFFLRLRKGINKPTMQFVSH